MNIGIDVGYYNTCYVTEGVKKLFTSIAEEDSMNLSDNLAIELDGKKYTIGVTGTFTSNSNKIEDEVFKLCLYTAIADSMKTSMDLDVHVITGLPIAYYIDQKDDLKKSLTNRTVTMSIIRKGKKENKTFRIAKVDVFPQSAGVMITNPELFKANTHTVVVDIGGFTTDISLFKGKELVPNRYRTLQRGMLKLNGVLKNHLSAKGMDIGLFEVRDLLANTDNLSNILSKEKLDKIQQMYVDSIIKDILVEFPEYAYCQRVFIGGGSQDLKQYINENVLDNSLFLNAEAYYRIGKVK